MPVAVIILAAGQGTRMKSDLPKVLHQIAHQPILHFAMDSAATLDPERVVVVTGHGGQAVADAARAHREDVLIAVQTEQLGTGHAADQARAHLADFDGDVIVLFGDTPFVRAETLQSVIAARTEGADVVVLGFEAENPGRYGRLKQAEDGSLEAIVEARDATPDELAITMCNSGIMAASAKTLFAMIDRIGTANASGEFYLTDVVSEARKDGLTARVITCTEDETLGINSRADLARAEAAFQAARRVAVLENGVTMTAPDTVFFAHDTHIGRDALIEPNVVFGPGVTVESAAIIRAFSHLEGCHVSQHAIVGPYARLRPGAELADGARVGNFVEVKNAQIGEGAKVNHLTYVGDATIGEAANIGAGTITCNYDGVFKHHTHIGARAFIGSNSSLVAPVRIGADAMTGSGSVVTTDVPDGALAIGRSRQANKENLAKRMMDRLRALKAKQNKGQ